MIVQMLQHAAAIDPCMHAQASQYIAINISGSIKFKIANIMVNLQVNQLI